MWIHLFWFIMRHAQVMSWGKITRLYLVIPAILASVTGLRDPTGYREKEGASYRQPSLHPWVSTPEQILLRVAMPAVKRKMGEAQTSSQLQHQDDDGAEFIPSNLDMDTDGRQHQYCTESRNKKRCNSCFVGVFSMCCRLILLEDNNISFILSTQEWKAPVDQYRGITVWMAISEGQQLAEWSTVCFFSM